MTEPTKQQIEAAMEAFANAAGYPMEGRLGKGSQLEQHIKAALTAAAEIDPTKGDDRWRDIAGQGIQTEFELRKEMLTLEVRTIERCAQVADNLEFIDGVGHSRRATPNEIAAAIRELKHVEHIENATPEREADLTLGLYPPLTAAAQVEDKDEIARRQMVRFNADAGNLKRRLDREEIKAATIERCAEVLDEYFGSADNLLSRRIRALKDSHE